MEVWDSLHKQLPSINRGETVKGFFDSNYFIKVLNIEVNCSCVTAIPKGAGIDFTIETKNRVPLPGQSKPKSYTATIVVTYELQGVRKTDKLQASFEFKD